MKKKDDDLLQSSFRDPSGHVFSRDGIVFRQINQTYRAHYELLISSGLCCDLVRRNLLIPHEEVPGSNSESSSVYKIIRPEQIPFISYPFEWCFSQLRDAAITTLDVFLSALHHGMILKDASAYNVQFRNGRPIFIDTLSFECYVEGRPWSGYRQFCQHFVAPLALMSLKDVRFGQLLRIYMDGIPLDFASRLVPFRTWFSFGMATHLHVHARLQKSKRSFQKASDQKNRTSSSMISRKALLGLGHSLLRLVNHFHPRRDQGDWEDYYDQTNYSDNSMRCKEEAVAEFIRIAKAGINSGALVWDLGANTGRFSRIAEREGCHVIAMDADHGAVENNYANCKANGTSSILPLYVDLSNPTGPFGWASKERLSLIDRGPADLIIALALIHHLAIANNVPLPRIADFFAQICDWLIIEFVPKEDSQAKVLLSSRNDIFIDYSESGFEYAFGKRFILLNRSPIRGSLRKLYLMKRKPNL